MRSGKVLLLVQITGEGAGSRQRFRFSVCSRRLLLVILTHGP